ncbi:MAG: PilZ domain-containing protein [Desulfuromonadales bacterium]|nr:MAG: PilZ domain-containing protein [Desulfuromonadales bacterium]
MITDKRQFCRIPFVAGSSIAWQEKRQEAELVDVSLKGALLKLDEPLPYQRGDSCTVSIELAHSDITIVFDAEIAHLRGASVGVKLTTIDIDSMIHLRNLLELNTADPEQIRKELSFLHAEE